jgi:hypothetical protein
MGEPKLNAKSSEAATAYFLAGYDRTLCGSNAHVDFSTHSTPVRLYGKYLQRSREIWQSMF